MVRRSLRVSLVVGTVLTAINQGNALLAGGLDWSLALRVLFTYAVPFLVSLYAMRGTVLAPGLDEPDRSVGACTTPESRLP